MGKSHLIRLLESQLVGSKDILQKLRCLEHKSAIRCLEHRSANERMRHLESPSQCGGSLVAEHMSAPGPDQRLDLLVMESPGHEATDVSSQSFQLPAWLEHPNPGQHPEGDSDQRWALPMHNLRDVLGVEPPDAALRALLQDTEGDLETAANRYLDLSPGCLPPSPGPSPSFSPSPGPNLTPSPVLSPSPIPISSPSPDQLTRPRTAHP